MGRKKKPAEQEHPLIGRKVRFKPGHMGTPKEGREPVVTGTVIWGHPKQRFVVVEYGYPKSLWRPAGTIRECLPYRSVAKEDAQYA